jgi:Flp pilus assembly protein protease CpaA
LLFLPLFVLSWLGAGDVKLLMAFAAWGGSHFALNVAVWSIILGGLLGFFQLLARRRLLDFLRRFWAFLQSWSYRELEPMAFRGDQTLRLPFAVPMAVAALGRSLAILPEALQWLR